MTHGFETRDHNLLRDYFRRPVFYFYKHGNINIGARTKKRPTNGLGVRKDFTALDRDVWCEKLFRQAAWESLVIL